MNKKKIIIFIVWVLFLIGLYFIGVIRWKSDGRRESESTPHLSISGPWFFCENMRNHFLIGKSVINEIREFEVKEEGRGTRTVPSSSNKRPSNLCLGRSRWGEKINIATTAVSVSYEYCYGLSISKDVDCIIN